MKNKLTIYDADNDYYGWDRYATLKTETTDSVYLDLDNVIYYSDSIQITNRNYKLEVELVNPSSASVETSIVEYAEIEYGNGTTCTFSGLLSESYTLKYSLKEDILGRQYRNAITVYTPVDAPTHHYARVGTDCFTITVQPSQDSWDSAMQTIFDKNAFFDCGNNAWQTYSVYPTGGTFITSGNTWTYTVGFVRQLNAVNYRKGETIDNTLCGGGFDYYGNTWSGVITDGGFGSNIVANKYWSIDNSVIYYSPAAYQYTTVGGQSGYAAHQTAWGTGIWLFPSWVHQSQTRYGLNYATVNFTPTVVQSLTNDYPEDGWQSSYYYKRLYEPHRGLSFTDIDFHSGIKYDLVCNTETNIAPGTVAGASISFILKDLKGLTVGDDLFYYNMPINQDFYDDRGMFIVTSIVKGEDSYTVTAYDLICKFDVNVKDWLNTLTYPMTVMSLLTQLCTHCNVTLNSTLTSFINSNMLVSNHFGTEQVITGRQVLQYIAQVAAGYVCCNIRHTSASDNANALMIETFGTTTTNIDNTEYSKLFYEDFACLAIDKVYVSNDTNVPGMSIGTGNNILSIVKNPLLYFDQASEIQTAVQNIYNEVSTHSSYTPMKISSFWRLSNVGECVRIDVGDGTTHIYKTACIFSESFSSSGFNYESTGEETRTS